MRKVSFVRLVPALMAIATCLAFAGRPAIAQTADQDDQSLRTQPGHSATFSVRLPLAADTADDGQTAPAPDA